MKHRQIKNYKDPPDKITKDDLKKWEEHCVGYHNNSLTPMYGAVKSYINHLIDSDILEETFDGTARRTLTAPKLQHDENDLSKLVLKPEQFNKIFEIAEKKNYLHYAMFKTMFWVMARRCEVIGFKISDIDFSNKEITYRPEIAKGGKRATVNIAQECLDILDTYIEKVRDKPKKKQYEDILFLHNGRPVSKTMMFEIHKTYSGLLGYNIHSHQWRHTGITQYARVEKDIIKVQKQARHEDVNQTIRYINYAKEEFSKSYHEKFANNNKIEQLKQEEVKPPQPPQQPQPPQMYAQQQPDITQLIQIITQQQKEIEELKKKRDVSYS